MNGSILVIVFVLFIFGLYMDFKCKYGKNSHRALTHELNNKPNIISPQEMQNRLLQTKEEFAALDSEIKKLVKKQIDELVYIINNNIKWLPDSVFSMDYTQQTIDAFVFYYTSNVIRPKVPYESLIFIIMLLALDTVYNGDTKRISQFNPKYIIKNTIFTTMPKMINTKIMFPIDNMTIPLVFIEKYMEKLTGRRTRYYMQFTPLIEAIGKKFNPEAVSALIKSGADVNAWDKAMESTPLLLAALTNTNPDVISILTKAGADINARDKYGFTPLMLAARNNSNPEIIINLIKAGADVNERNERGWTPLILAAANNSNPEVITALVKAGADINAKHDNEPTPIFVAAANNSNPEVIKVLVKAGADVNKRDKNGRTPLIAAAASKTNSNPDIITTLLNLGADAQIKDNFGNRAIDHVIKNGKLNKNIDIFDRLGKLSFPELVNLNLEDRNKQ